MSSEQRLHRVVTTETVQIIHDRCNNFYCLWYLFLLFMDKVWKKIILFGILIKTVNILFVINNL